VSPTAITTLLTATALLGAIGLAVLVVVLLRRRLGIGTATATSHVGRLLEANGAARAMEAVALLRGLASRTDADEVVTAWFRIAPAIEAALPSCPPALRGLVRQALMDASASCQSKSVAKAMLDCAARCRGP
jgi:hypothetical protein